jgi:hypothetical protein
MENAIQLTMSPRNAGQVELATFCPRCCWYAMRLKKMPFQFGMPGIMFYLEKAEKSLLLAQLAATGSLGKCVPELKNCNGVADFPFSMKHEHKESGVMLTARPDMIFTLDYGTLLLADLKTSKPNGGGKAFLPQYEVQVTGYSWVTTEEGIGRVTSACLIYGDIQLDEFLKDPCANKTATGFRVPFNFVYHKIDLDYERLTRCLKEFKKVWASIRPPAGREGCKDCILLNRVFNFEAEMRGQDGQAALCDRSLHQLALLQNYHRQLATGTPAQLVDIMEDSQLEFDDAGTWANWDFS